MFIFNRTIRNKGIKYCLLAIMSMFCFAFAHAVETDNKIITASDYDINFVFFDKYEVEYFNQGKSRSSNIEIIHLANQQLPQRISLNQLPLSRIFRELENPKPMCVPAMIKTSKRAAKYIFSKPTGITLSTRVFAREFNNPITPSMLNDKGEIKSLSSLVEYNGKLRFMYSHSRSYGEEIDKQIGMLAEDNKAIIFTPSYFGRDIELFSKGRADLLITTPVVLDRHYSEEATQLKAYKIANSKPFMLGHMMCNNNPKTQAFIEDFDTFLNDFYQDQAFVDVHLDAHSEKFQEEILELMDAVFGPNGLNK